MRSSPALLAAAALLGLAGSAAAAPQDVTLSGLDVYEGEPYTNYQDIGLAYETVVADIGAGIANKPMGGSTLGLDGFEVMATATSVFVTGNRYQGGPTAWERAREGNATAGALFLPGVGVRKGLPFSLEAGGTLAWMGNTRQGTVGGYGRFSPLEGVRKAPEIAVQLGHTGYIGNEELDLSVTDASLSIGNTWAFGPRSTANTSTIHPYLAAGMNWIKAAPRLSADRAEELGLGPISASKKDTDAFRAGLRPVVLHLGTRIVSGDVGFRVGATVPLGASPTLDGSIGYAF